MKKRLSIMLVLCMVLSLCMVPVALAAGVTVLSTQNLAVDGKVIPCEKYNIDGSNYFKLRDMAYLLNGTASQFAVGWDAASSTVSITTGQPYTPNGTELKLDGGDKSATSVPSSQTIKIDGVVVSNLSVYNIGGNNYFKLRDLGNALGFEVGYDAATFTATVFTATEDTVVWLPVKTTKNYNNYITVTAYNYDAYGNLIEEWSGKDINNPDYYSIITYMGDEKEVYTQKKSNTGVMEPNSSERYIYENGKLRTYEMMDLQYGGTTRETYDDHGNVVSEIQENLFQYTEYAYEHTYDAAGKLVKTVKTSVSDWKVVSTVTYTYNDKGQLATQVSVDHWGDQDTMTFTYDAKGNLIREHYYAPWSEYTIDYTYDAEGNQIKMVSEEKLPDGYVDSLIVTTEYELYCIEQ